MSTRIPTPNFRGRRAVVLHRPHGSVENVLRQLERLGVEAVQRWPDLRAGDAGADILLFDADMGYDEQFPWQPGQAPMPLIALVGSEAPGRLEWMLAHGACGHLLKPVGSGGVYSALVIACHAFSERAGLRDRLRQRPVVAQAVALLMTAQGLGEDDAYRTLRSGAMARRQNLETYCRALLAAPGAAGRLGS